MRLIASFMAIWISAVALGAAWSSYGVSYDQAAYQDDAYITRVN